MLRPSNSFLGSSRPTWRANVRAQRLRSVGHVFKAAKGAFLGLFGGVVDLALLWLLPFLYLASAYLTLDLPARWFSHRGAYGSLGIMLFIAAVAISIVGVSRAVQGSPPIAPVRPRFARAMLGLSWLAALLFTIGDLAP